MKITYSWEEFLTMFKVSAAAQQGRCYLLLRIKVLWLVFWSGEQQRQTCTFAWEVWFRTIARTPNMETKNVRLEVMELHKLNCCRGEIDIKQTKRLCNCFEFADISWAYRILPSRPECLMFRSFKVLQYKTGGYRADMVNHPTTILWADMRTNLMAI